jgi:hypothetical protein
MTRVLLMLAKAAVIAVLAIATSSCKHSISFGSGEKGNGNITTVSRDIAENFTAIDANTGIEVIVIQADEKSVTVEADSNLQDLISVEVHNGVLEIESTDSYHASQTPKVTVKMRVVTGLAASSGSSIKNEAVLIAKTLDVSSSSGSSVSLNVEAEELSLESSSGSTLRASGKALKLKTRSSSGSEIDAEHLLANDVTADASSGSSIDVRPVLNLVAHANSGGDIDYHQIPKNISKSENSGGSVSGRKAK